MDLLDVDVWKLCVELTRWCELSTEGGAERDKIMIWSGGSAPLFTLLPKTLLHVFCGPITEEDDRCHYAAFVPPAVFVIGPNSDGELSSQSLSRLEPALWPPMHPNA